MGAALANNNIFMGSWNSTKGRRQLSQEDIAKAYITGWNDGKEEAFKEFISLLEKNIEKAQKIGEDFLKTNKEDGKRFYTTYLSLSSPAEFKLLFIVDPEIYYTEEIDKIYKDSIAISKENNTEGFNITMSFMPKKDSINKERLVADGFLLHYEQK